MGLLKSARQTPEQEIDTVGTKPDLHFGVKACIQQNPTRLAELRTIGASPTVHMRSLPQAHMGSIDRGVVPKWGNTLEPCRRKIGPCQISPNWTTW